MNKEFLGVRYRIHRDEWYAFTFTSRISYFAGYPLNKPAEFKHRFDGQVFHTLNQKYKKNIKKIMEN